MPNSPTTLRMAGPWLCVGALGLGACRQKQGGEAQNVPLPEHNTAAIPPDTTAAGLWAPDRATRLARHMVLRWGMSEALGPFASGQGAEQVFLGGQIMQPRDHSEETAGAVDDEVRRILRNAAGRARGTLEENREALDRVAERLLDKEEITGREVAELVGGG